MSSTNFTFHIPEGHNQIAVCTISYRAITKFVEMEIDRLIADDWELAQTFSRINGMIVGIYWKEME